MSNRYTTARVTSRDVFPSDVDDTPVMQWILERTLMRPRDCIAFVNEAIRQAAGRSRITAAMLREAEGHYSRGRLRSLADEWAGDFPTLIRFAELLKLRPSKFRVGDLADGEVESFCLEVAVESLPSCPLRTVAIAVSEGNLSARTARNAVIEVFFKVGLIGLKLERYESYVWASRGRRSISSAEINDETRLAVNPPFWRTLGVTP